jgi:hypothetical protein
MPKQSTRHKTDHRTYCSHQYRLREIAQGKTCPYRTQSTSKSSDPNILSGRPAWYYIKLLNKLGAISSYRDDKKLFYARYHNPYVAGKEHKKK